MWVDRQATVQETIQPKILLVVAMGGALFIVGMVLLAFAEHVAAYMRFLLPFPPIGVAAYIYVLNKLAITPTDLTVRGKRRALVADVLTETVIRCHRLPGPLATDDRRLAYRAVAMRSLTTTAASNDSPW